MRVIVKIGGSVLDDKRLARNCARAVSELAGDGAHQVAVVHGGGTALTRTLLKLGIQSEFVNGLRVTDAETRDIALMVLAGAVNKALVAQLGAVGQSAVGMCGGDGLTFRARKKTNATCDLGFVGEICSVDSRWIEAIWSAGSMPVISSIALGNDGQYYNINADQMAASCAVATKANALVFLTDVPGVKNAEGSVIHWLQSDQISGMIKDSVITGGMLPKLEACQEALRRGVPRVRILPASHVESLPQLYVSKINYGTEVLAA